MWQTANVQFGHLRLGAAGLAVLAAAGCTSSGSPADPSSALPTYTPPRVSIETSPSTPATSSPSFATTGPNVRPGEKPPVLPAVGMTDSAVGAAEFAKYFMEALDWGYATTDSTLAKSLYAPSCSDCALAMRTFDEVRAKNEHFRGGRVAISKWFIAPNDHRNGATEAVDVTFSAQSLEVIDSSGKVVESDPAVKSMTFRFWLRWYGTNWLVVQKGRVV